MTRDRSRTTMTPAIGMTTPTIGTTMAPTTATT
jgi:hypothetical protein